MFLNGVLTMMLLTVQFYKFSTSRGLRGGDHLNEIVGSRCSGNKGGALVGLAFGFRIAQNH